MRACLSGERGRGKDRSCPRLEQELPENAGILQVIKEDRPG